MTAVTFIANGKTIGEGTPSADGWQFTWKNATPGTYTVMARATDKENLIGVSAPITVTIKADNVPPVVTVKAGHTSLWPPDQQYVTIRLADLLPGATDNCGTVSPVVTIRRVTSDEADNAKGSGNTRNDIIISSDAKSVQLRAERVEGGNGRVYTITVGATDAAGNTGTTTYQVHVPIGAEQLAVADPIANTVNAKGAARQVAEGDGLVAEVAGDISVYPNPSRGSHIQVSVYSAVRQMGCFTLVNSLSREMLRLEKPLEAGNNQVHLWVDQVPRGMYLLQVRKDNQVITRKVVINK